MPPLGYRTNRHAAALRRGQTDAERTLWFALRNRQLGGYKFRRQVSLGPYVVDFLCVDAWLVVEVDGGQHHPGVDATREQAISALGFRVIRYWNNDISSNPEGVFTHLLATLEARVATLTQPSPKGRGL